MQLVLLPRHPGLADTSRLRWLANAAVSPTVWDWLTLAAIGALAACSSAFLDDGIKRMPGHAILRVVFPIALGLAVVPRQGAGCMMAGSAALTAGLLRWGGTPGEGLGLGALTSLVAIGPLLDFTLRRARGGWWQIGAFAVAGFASNLLALGVRGGAKWIGWEALGRRPLAEWITQAAFTYVVFGLAAGVISGVILFSFRQRDERPQPEPVG